MRTAQADGDGLIAGVELLGRLLGAAGSGQPARARGGSVGLAALPAALLCREAAPALTALSATAHKVVALRMLPLSLNQSVLCHVI